jgi:hypothetical protein
MQQTLIFATSAATRKLYQKTLISRDITPYIARSAAEVFLQLATFEIDTIIMIDEGKFYDLDIILKVLDRRYNDKRIILISPNEDFDVPERYPTTPEFFDIL